jgi:C-terminal processing protease CtpA/Prc
VITIRGFGDDRGPGAVAYPEFIQKTFRELADKKVAGLIIDVRGNGGGRDEFGRLLFAHFMDEPFLYYKALERKRDKYDLVKYIGGGGESTGAGALRKNARGWYDVLDHPNVGIMKPETPRFMGRTAILVDGLSFSTTGESTSLFHYHKKAVFVGEECGAGYYGNTSGGMVLVTLPKTRLQVIVPLTLYTLAVDGYPKDRGIVPDYPVTPTIEDLLAGRDVVMEKALMVLGKK